MKRLIQAEPGTVSARARCQNLRNLVDFFAPVIYSHHSLLHEDPELIA